ncbi:MAG: pitrilysin family protein [Rikenellaceae bacterium]
MMEINFDDVALRSAECRTLSNGVKVYSLPSDEFEVLRVSFVFAAGSVFQPRPFVATTTANLLSEGSRSMSARDIAERLDYHGSYFDVNVDRDYSYFSFCSLSKFVGPTLDVAEQILLYPTFPEAEIKTYCAKRKQRLRIEREKVETKAREHFAKSLFGENHPYGVSSSEELYDSIKRADLVDMYERFYTAERCFVVCSGRINDSEMARIEAVAGAIRSGEAIPQREFPEVVSRPFHLTEQADAVQSSIRIGRRLFTRSHPDFLGMQLLATALGGYFGSRLMQSLREERGYTYGVMSAMVNFARDGYFAIATQVGVEVTREAIDLIYKEVERLRNEPLSEQELEMVCRIMVGEIMRILDGPFGVADVTIENILCECDNSVIEENVRRIATYTPSQLQELARRYLDPKDMVCVVSGLMGE